MKVREILICGCFGIFCQLEDHLIQALQKPKDKLAKKDVWLPSGRFKVDYLDRWKFLYNLDILGFTMNPLHDTKADYSRLAKEVPNLKVPILKSKDCCVAVCLKTVAHGSRICAGRSTDPLESTEDGAFGRARENAAPQVRHQQPEGGNEVLDPLQDHMGSGQFQDRHGLYGRADAQVRASSRPARSVADCRLTCASCVGGGLPASWTLSTRLACQYTRSRTRTCSGTSTGP